MIIDGQQRLITISLFLLSIHDYLASKKDKTIKEEGLQEDIMNDYLINKRAVDKSQRIRLKPNNKDQEYFESLFEQNKRHKKDSNIIQNYNFFYEKVSQSNISSEELFELFKKLEIVNIELEKNIDDPQLIFESLNSTGVDLNDGDLIRNYILMDLDLEEQNNLYKNYWQLIEKLSGNVANFVRAFLIYVYEKNITQSRRAVYIEFKKYSEDFFNRSSLDILEKLLHYAEIYSYFINNQNHPNQKINEALYRLYRLDFTVCYPFLFHVFNLYNDDKIDENEIVKIINLIESYAFRKILVDNSTTGLNKVFLILAKEIKKESTSELTYFETMSYVISNKSGSQKFPTDDEFRETLIYKEIYKLKPKNKEFLFENLENYDSAYKINIEELTIEHIMPQKLTNIWKKNLGERYEEIHKKYLHTLGNLSLTGKNSSLSNKDFEEKKKIDFENSKLSLNYKLVDIKEWNENAILHRGKELANRAVNIWIYPESDHIKQKSKDKFYDLSDDVNFTGCKPKILMMKDKEYTVNSWRQVLLIVCKYLFELSPSDFKFIMFNSELKRYFADEENSQKLTTPKEFVNSYFVEGNQSSNSIISICLKLCEKLNFDPSDISLQILDN